MNEETDAAMLALATDSYQRWALFKRAVAGAGMEMYEVCDRLKAIGLPLQTAIDRVAAGTGLPEIIGVEQAGVSS